MEYKCFNLEENNRSKSTHVMCERFTDTDTDTGSTSAHISSTKELSDAIELTWYHHLELGNERDKLEMECQIF